MRKETIILRVTNTIAWMLAILVSLLLIIFRFAPMFLHKVYIVQGIAIGIGFGYIIYDIFLFFLFLAAKTRFLLWRLMSRRNRKGTYDDAKIERLHSIMNDSVSHLSDDYDTSEDN